MKSHRCGYQKSPVLLKQSDQGSKEGMVGQDFPFSIEEDYFSPLGGGNNLCGEFLESWLVVCSEQFEDARRLWSMKHAIEASILFSMSIPNTHLTNPQELIVNVHVYLFSFWVHSLSKNTSQPWVLDFVWTYASLMRFWGLYNVSSSVKLSRRVPRTLGPNEGGVTLVRGLVPSYP